MRGSVRLEILKSGHCLIWNKRGKRYILIYHSLLSGKISTFTLASLLQNNFALVARNRKLGIRTNLLGLKPLIKVPLNTFVLAMSTLSNRYLNACLLYIAKKHRTFLKPSKPTQTELHYCKANMTEAEVTAI